jgi:hypothetical protein
MGGWGLGVAQYRAGLYREALATLTRSDRIYAKIHQGSRPVDLAFVAMAQDRLGRQREARATFERLVQAMENPAVSNDQQAEGFLHEAEVLLLQGKKVPEPVMARSPFYAEDGHR